MKDSEGSRWINRSASGNPTWHWLRPSCHRCSGSLTSATSNTHKGPRFCSDFAETHWFIDVYCFHSHQSQINPESTSWVSSKVFVKPCFVIQFAVQGTKSLLIWQPIKPITWLLPPCCNPQRAPRSARRLSRTWSLTCVTSPIASIIEIHARRRVDLWKPYDMYATVHENRRSWGLKIRNIQRYFDVMDQLNMMDCNPVRSLQLPGRFLASANCVAWWVSTALYTYRGINHIQSL